MNLIQNQNLKISDREASQWTEWWSRLAQVTAALRQDFFVELECISQAARSFDSGTTERTRDCGHDSCWQTECMCSWIRNEDHDHDHKLLLFQNPKNVTHFDSSSSSSHCDKKVELEGQESFGSIVNSQPSAFKLLQLLRRICDEV